MTAPSCQSLFRRQGDLAARNQVPDPFVATDGDLDVAAGAVHPVRAYAGAGGERAEPVVGIVPVDPAGQEHQVDEVVGDVSAGMDLP